MNISILEAYAKAYEVALFGRGKNDRAHHEARPLGGEAPINANGPRSSGGFRGLIRSRRP